MQTSVPARIRDLLKCEEPLVLLTYNEAAVRALLEDLGIDTGDWASGLESLLQ